MTNQWSSIRIGELQLEHRLAMAPMTRSRATATGVLTALSAEYYAQRASMGLIITEGTQPSDDGQGYLRTPASTPRITWLRGEASRRQRTPAGATSSSS